MDLNHGTGVLQERLGVIAAKRKGHYKVRIKPFALATPRNIPLSLRPKAEEELKRMEELGVITKVNECTHNLVYSYRLLRESTGQKKILQKNSLLPHTSVLLVQTLFSVSL